MTMYQQLVGSGVTQVRFLYVTSASVAGFAGVEWDKWETASTALSRLKMLTKKRKGPLRRAITHFRTVSREKLELLRPVISEENMRQEFSTALISGGLFP
jgi:hypothetical protein